ncbi:hypothetical protein EOPP23_02480 [Endozoicomonas sp. OPT23]|uniref:S1/P1 nuclease n=1 Tax=Endozoicomonas sp. OPT23 TaxID=2072845 RepID=UPI00129A6AAA|nr:S1/P1 nuclease [Endozoicomonas sp. OPT23]MRI31862.1 hypothetical protein [Endozoicomonas sp. OPT23]
MLRLLIAVTFLISSSVYGWFDAAHMTSSWITWQNLKPDVRREVKLLIREFQNVEPKTDDFVRSSSWMDGVKGRGLWVTGYWHTISEESVKNGKVHGPYQQHGVWLVNEAVDTLSSTKSSMFSRAFMLRALIHVSQDLHSPMHVCDDRDDRPESSKKCYKAFRISPVKFHDETIDNLASLWDSGVLAFPPDRMEDKKANRNIARFSKKLLARTDKAALPDLNELNPLKWATESLEIQKQFALKGIRSGSALSAEYIKEGQRISEQRIVIAGYRLANLLNHIFEKNSELGS